MEQKTAFDGAIRRRIYLCRHGEVSYVDDSGQHVKDSRVVPLTPYGHEQATDMGKMLQDVFFDKAACSGLLRTQQTVAGILAGRELDVEEIPALEEIGSGQRDSPELVMDPNDVAYSFWRAAEPGAAFMGGELFQGFYDRVTGGIEGLVARTDWSQMLLVCHGGTNRAVLCWALGSGLNSFGVFEQDTCCV
ncbi:MAG: histidine phosphatase family protein, partial [Pseudomonadota bacterium]